MNSGERKYHDPAKSLSLTELNFPEGYDRLNASLKLDFTRFSLNVAPNLATQIYALHCQSPNPNNESIVIYSKQYLSLVFQLPVKTISNYIQTGKKYQKGCVRKSAGAQPKVTEEMINEIIQHITINDSKNTALTKLNIVQFIESRWGVIITKEWVNSMVKKHSDRLKIVLAKPLELKRAEVSKESIETHLNNLNTFCDLCHPSLIFNIDETGLGSSKPGGQRKVVVSNSNTKKDYYYSQDLRESHITFLVGICTDGTLIKTLSVVQGLTLHAELGSLGLLNRFMKTYSQSSGYITSELFLRWVEDIFVVEVDNRRSLLSIPHATAGIIMDGLKSHINNDVEALFTKNNIISYILPPHSSHITQPLDLVIFSAFKRQFSQIKEPQLSSKLSTRLLKGMKALHSVATPWNIQSSFHRSGIFLNYDEYSLQVSRNINYKLNGSFIASIEYVGAPITKNKRKRLTNEHNDNVINNCNTATPLTNPISAFTENSIVEQSPLGFYLNKIISNLNNDNNSYSI